MASLLYLLRVPGAAWLCARSAKSASSHTRTARIRRYAANLGSPQSIACRSVISILRIAVPCHSLWMSLGHPFFICSECPERLGSAREAQRAQVRIRAPRVSGVMRRSQFFPTNSVPLRKKHSPHSRTLSLRPNKHCNYDTKQYRKSGAYFLSGSLDL